MDIFGTDIWFSDCRFAGVRCLILWFNAKLSLLFPTRSTPDQSLRIWSHTWNLFAFLFWIASKYFLFFNSNHTHFFSAHLSLRMFSPIHPYSEWPALSLQVCVCEQDPLFNQKLNELMQIFVRFLIMCQKHPRSPKHSHAPFCKLMAHCAIQELFTLHWNSSCAWRFTGSLGYLITQNTQHKRIFLHSVSETKKTRAAVVAQNPPTLVRKRAIVAVS